MMTRPAATGSSTSSTTGFPAVRTLAQDGFHGITPLPDARLERSPCEGKPQPGFTVPSGALSCRRLMMRSRQAALRAPANCSCGSPSRASGLPPAAAARRPGVGFDPVRRGFGQEGAAGSTVDPVAAGQVDATVAGDAQSQVQRRFRSIEQGRLAP
jgi:hypothetical protein